MAADLDKIIDNFTPSEGLDFLEHLAHDLTEMVRFAAGERKPYGNQSAEQALESMYWNNEALHNVVQFTRNLRIGREVWDAEEIKKWITSWRGYQHASEYNVDKAIM